MTTTHPTSLTTLEAPPVEDAFITDAADAHQPDWSDAALPDELLAVTPAPPPVDVDKLQEVVARHRVLILRRGAVIAVSTLLSIGGALFLHSLLGGAFIAALLFGTRALPIDTGPGTGGDAPSEGGRGYMMLADAGDAEAAAKAGTPDALASLLRADVSSAQASPPALPVAAEPPPPTPVDIRTLIPTPPTAALEVPNDFGAVTIKPPVRTPQPAPAPELRVLPPDISPALAPSVAAASPAQDPRLAAAASGLPAAGPRGNFGLADDGEDDLPSTFKTGRAGGPGRGTGRGRGIGAGLDRGPSGADRPEPTVLDNPMPSTAEQPSWLRTNPPRAAVVFRVKVLETGAIGDIQVVASSGRPEVDAYYREVISRWKFAPAILGGRPVARTTDMTFDPRAL